MKILLFVVCCIFLFVGIIGLAGLHIDQEPGLGPWLVASFCLLFGIAGLLSLLTPS